MDLLGELAEVRAEVQRGSGVEPASAIPGIPGGHQALARDLLVGASPIIRPLSREVEFPRGVLFAVAADTILVQYGLNVPYIMNRIRACIAWLVLEFLDRMSHGHRSGPGRARCFSTFLVATHAGAFFARPEVDEGGHVLQLHVILIQRLEEEILAGRGGKGSRPVFVHRRNTVDLLAMDRTVSAKPEDSFFVPGPGQRAHHPDVLDSSPFDARHALIDVLHE